MTRAKFDQVTSIDLVCIYVIISSFGFMTFDHVRSTFLTVAFRTSRVTYHIIFHAVRVTKYPGKSYLIVRTMKRRRETHRVLNIFEVPDSALEALPFYSLT